MTDLRLRYLDDDEAERLYASHPGLGRSPDVYCPTCEKRGFYRLNGQKFRCDCELQLQLHKHYLAAGIGMTYQQLGWADLKDPTILAQVIDYAENKEYARRGRGLILFGDIGSGKTMAATLCLKEFVREGFSCFATTFAKMVELYTAGWHSDEERIYVHRKVVESQVLLLDDIGREHKRKNRLSETTFDDVLRTRVQHRRSTLITSMLTPEELAEGYGGAVLRLLREKAKAIEVTGEDFSKQANQREQDEIEAGETRPIV